MRVTAGTTTTAAGMLFLSNGCCVAVRGSSSGGAGVFPCLQHGKPAAHLDGEAAASDLLGHSIPTHHDPISPCSARARVLESRLARPSGPNARGARRPRRCSNDAHFLLPPRCSHGSRGQCVPPAQGQGCGRRKRTSARRTPSFCCLCCCVVCGCCLDRGDTPAAAKILLQARQQALTLWTPWVKMSHICEPVMNVLVCVVLCCCEPHNHVPFLFPCPPNTCPSN